MWREGIEECSDAFPCCVDGAFGCLSQESFELCEDLLDWIEVWRVRWQEEDVCTGSADGASHGLAFVAAEIVEDDDIAGLECRGQDLLDISEEASAIDRSVEHGRGVDPVMAERGKEGERLPVTERHLGTQPLSTRGAAMGPRHIGLGPGLINEDEATWIEPTLVAFPTRPSAYNVTPILLAGQYAFF